MGFASLYPSCGIIPLSGKHKQICARLRLAALDAMRHDRARSNTSRK
jgi:hypothetical protein